MNISSIAQHLYGDLFPQEKVEAFDLLWSTYDWTAFIELITETYTCPESAVISDHFTQMGIDDLPEDDESRRFMLVRTFDSLFLQDDSEEILADLVDGSALYNPETDEIELVYEDSSDFVTCDLSSCWCHYALDMFLNRVISDDDLSHMTEETVIDTQDEFTAYGLLVDTDSCGLAILEGERVDLTPPQLLSWLHNLNSDLHNRNAGC